MEDFQPQAWAQAQLHHWAQQEKLCRQRQKQWKEVGELLAQGDLSRLLKRLPQLEAHPAEELETLKHWASQEEKQRPLRFTRQLRECAEMRGLECQVLGSSPPTLRLDPLEVELDFSKGEAVLRYARLELHRLPLEPEKILLEREKQLRALEGDAFQPEAYLHHLYQAYRRVLLSQQARPGERVELVELLPELAFLLQNEKFRREPSRETFRPYGKARFAFDLARLRRARTLEIQSQRLNLGTATLGSTRNKERVLYLEEAGQGQYYLSLSFQGVS